MSITPLAASILKPSEFVKYEWSMSTASSAPVDVIYKLARAKLPAALEAKFTQFASAIIDTHGKDLTVSTEPSRSGTPVSAAASTSTGVSSATKMPPATKPAKKTEEKKAVNTARVTVEATFMAAADDLFSILTDEKRIPLWSRAAAQVGFIYSSSFNVS